MKWSTSALIVLILTVLLLQAVTVQAIPDAKEQKGLSKNGSGPEAKKISVGRKKDGNDDDDDIVKGNAKDDDDNDENGLFSSFKIFRAGRSRGMKWLRNKRKTITKLGSWFSQWLSPSKDSPSTRNPSKSKPVSTASKKSSSSASRGESSGASPPKPPVKKSKPGEESGVDGIKSSPKKGNVSPVVPAPSKSPSKATSEVNCDFTDVTDCGEAYKKGNPIGGISVVVETACAFLKMKKAAQSSNINLRLNSGFRTHAEQTRLYNCYLTKKCNSGNLAAKPGFSNHQNGIALDISVVDTSVYKWMTENASRFGFVRTVPSEKWHWELRPEAGCSDIVKYTCT
ncbi:hedgehog signaling/DD-peptidase zinc-binding domain-containing protein [Chytridium lagenaria]|nr:hedgehog signaling/DD-peptidase zinc-binding domain-containing protein [Chytridium lagenaria]